MITITERIEQQRDLARSVCATIGKKSSDCAAAWDALEELQAEASHQRQHHPNLNTLEEFCLQYPEAIECLVYDT